jgi:hypothetical protein
MLSKQQRNGRESRKQQEMSDEVKVGKRLRSLDLQGEREERETEGHVRDAGPCGPRG